MRDKIKIWGRYYDEPSRKMRDEVAIRGRRSAAKGTRYLSNYLKQYQGVEVEPPKQWDPSSVPTEGAIAEVMQGLESETDVELLRRKVIRLAAALEAAERERDELRSRLMRLEGALSNLDNVITSDLDSASDKEKKLELLKVVFEENKKLREDLGGE